MSIILSLSPPFSLFLPLFFRLIPWSTEALCIRFPAWTSKTQWRRRSVSSFQLEGALHLHSGERVPAASVNRASPFSGTLLAFCVNQGISASILSSLIHSFIHSLTPSHFGYPGSNQSRTPASKSVQPHRRQPTWLPHPWDSPGKNTGVDSHCLLHCTEYYGYLKTENKERGEGKQDE